MRSFARRRTERVPFTPNLSSYSDRFLETLGWLMLLRAFSLIWQVLQEEYPLRRTPSFLLLQGRFLDWMQEAAWAVCLLRFSLDYYYGRRGGYGRLASCRPLTTTLTREEVVPAGVSLQGGCLEWASWIRSTVSGRSRWRQIMEEMVRSPFVERSPSSSPGGSSSTIGQRWSTGWLELAPLSLVRNRGERANDEDLQRLLPRRFPDQDLDLELSSSIGILDDAPLLVGSRSIRQAPSRQVLDRGAAMAREPLLRGEDERTRRGKMQ